MNVEYHPITINELNEAQTYFNQIAPGLGDDLRLEIFSKIEHVKSNPLNYRDVSCIRRALLKRFPYSVHFGYAMITLFAYLLSAIMVVIKHNVVLQKATV